VPEESLRPLLDETGVMIGLEVHVQLNKLNTKMFCGCGVDYHNDAPNTHTCPVCLGLPGSLPVINRKAVEYSIKVGLALNCSIQDYTQFYRKNYYYPDLPKGFQITQYDYPLASNGYINIEGEKAEVCIRINRAHMEEDPGRLVHEGGSIERSKYTLIDYNRSGVALLEIVTEPDLRSPKEARRFLDKLRNILEYLDVCDTSLEGATRVDANISLAGGSRSEVKNISSHKGAERALLFEIVRQKNLLRRGGTVTLETRHFDEVRGVTISMRTKEEEHDYRYYPEADLVSIKVADWAPDIQKTLPELPDLRRQRFVSLYGITDDHAKSLTSQRKVADFYETVIRKCSDHYKPDGSIDDYIQMDIASTSAVWIADVLKGELNYRDADIDSIEPDNMVSLVRMIHENRITDRNAVEIMRTVLDEGGTPEEIVEAKGLLKAAEDIVGTAVDEAINENPQAVKDYHKGKQGAINFVVGQVMKKTKGGADAEAVRKMIIRKIG
jgi:aspartyl-tRNA(Asn)/glutamyl-tRNA(Gln) amidotransferase subunit B